MIDGSDANANVASNVKSKLTNEVRKNNTLGSVISRSTTTMPTLTTTTSKVSSKKSDDENDHNLKKSHITSTVPSLFDNKLKKDPTSWRTKNNNRHSSSTISTTTEATIIKTGSIRGGGNKFKFGDKKLTTNNEKESNHDKDNADNENKKKTAQNNGTNQSKTSIHAKRGDTTKTTISTTTPYSVGSTSTTLSVFKNTNQERIEKLKAKYNKRPGSAHPVLVKPTTTHPRPTESPKNESINKNNNSTIVTESPKGTSTNPTRFTSKDVRRPSLMMNKWRASQQRPQSSNNHKKDQKVSLDDNNKSGSVIEEKKKLDVYEPEAVKADITSALKSLEPKKNIKTSTLIPKTPTNEVVTNKYFHKETVGDLERYNNNPLRKPSQPNRPQYKLIAPSNEPPGYHRPKSSTNPVNLNRLNQFVPSIVSPPDEQHLSSPQLSSSAPPTAKHVSYFNIHENINKISPPSIAFSYPTTTSLPEVVVTVENKYIYVRNKTTTVERPVEMMAPPRSKIKILPPPEHYMPPQHKNKYENYVNSFNDHQYQNIEQAKVGNKALPPPTMPVPTSNYFYYPDKDQINSKPTCKFVNLFKLLIYNTFIIIDDNKVIIKRPTFEPESTTQMTKIIKPYPSIEIPSKTYSHHETHKDTSKYHHWNVPKIEQTSYQDYLSIPKPHDEEIDKAIEHKAPIFVHATKYDQLKKEQPRDKQGSKYEYYNTIPQVKKSFPKTSSVPTTVPVINNKISLKMKPEKAKAVIYHRQHPKPLKKVNAGTKWNEKDEEPMTVPLLTDLRPKIYSHHYQPSSSRIFKRLRPHLIQAGPEVTEDKLLYTDTIETLPPPPPMHKTMFAPLPPPTSLRRPLIDSSSTFHQRLMNVNYKPSPVIYSNFPTPRVPLPVTSSSAFSYLHPASSAHPPIIPLHGIPFRQQDTRKIFTRQVVNDDLSHRDFLDSPEGISSYRVEQMLNATESGVDPFEEYYSDQILPVNSMIDFSLVWPRLNQTIPTMLTASSNRTVTHVDQSTESSTPRTNFRLLPPFNKTTKKLYDLFSSSSLFYKGNSKPVKLEASIGNQQQIVDLPQQNNVASQNGQSKIFTLDAADNQQNLDNK